jgi:alanyl-tRNA synthetase
MNEYRYYWEDPLRMQFDVTIASIVEIDGQTYIKINEPVVKPSGGGQAGDRGTIEIDGKSIEFIDTARQEGSSLLLISHALEGGKSAVLKIDIKWRMSMMRNHTAEHLFVGFLKKNHQRMDLGRIWIDGNHGTITLQGIALTNQDILEAESHVQRQIAKQLQVVTKIVSTNEVSESVRAREGVTSKHDTIRIVNVGEVDSSACSGIHVTNTGDIRAFKIIDIKTHLDETHIEFITGEIAIDKLVSLFNVALLRRHSYPLEYEQLEAVLDKAKALQESYEGALQKIIELMKNGPQKEMIGDVEFWYEYMPGFDTNSIREILRNVITQSPCIILFFAAGAKTNFVFWARGMPNDAAYYVHDIVASLGGRGGGSKESYTGGFADASNPLELYHEVVKSVKDILLDDR